MAIGSQVYVSNYGKSLGCNIFSKRKGMAGNHTLMIWASLVEKDNLIISLLYPQLVRLDVRTKPSDINKIQNFQQFSSKNAEASDLSAIFRLS